MVFGRLSVVVNVGVIVLLSRGGSKEGEGGLIVEVGCELRGGKEQGRNRGRKSGREKVREV